MIRVEHTSPPAPPARPATEPGEYLAPSPSAHRDGSESEATGSQGLFTGSSQAIGRARLLTGNAEPENPTGR
jgi:hypothetical protein